MEPIPSFSSVFSFFSVPVCLLENLEVDLDVHLDDDWLAVLHGRSELVLANGFHCLLVQSKADAPQDANVSRTSVRIDLQVDQNVSGNLCLASLFRELRLRSEEDLGRRDTATDAPDAATHIAAAAWSNTAAVA